MTDKPDRVTEAPEIRKHSDEAWNIASRFSYALSSSTRDLAAYIDAALAAARQEARREALEEAARECERHVIHRANAMVLTPAAGHAGDDYAALIRALGEKE